MIQPDVRVNYQGVSCPYNYVKTKLVLETMEIGQIVEVVVDTGEPSRHVPRSVQQDGHTILDQFTDEEGLTHILIRKTVD